MAHLDKTAFRATTRPARRAFAAACDRPDVTAPALLSERVEATGWVKRVRRSSLTVEAPLALYRGLEKSCARGRARSQ